MKIVGISGKKQAGKNTVCNFLLGQYLVQTGQIENYHIDAQTGELCLSKDAEVPYLIYSFADYLKEVAISIFGIPYENVYGTDEQKNQLTHIMWENMPLYTSQDMNEGTCGHYPTNGPMTAREFLQILGTDVFRRIYGPVWVESLMRRIKNDNPPVAFICDARFDNEIEAIEKEGGMVIRLLRSPHKDSHKGEIALDNYQFKYVVDNREMDIPTQNYEVFKLVKEYLF